MPQSEALRLLERLQEKAYKKDIVSREFIKRIKAVVNDPSRDIYIGKHIDADFSFMSPGDRDKVKKWFFDNWQEVSKSMPTPYEEPLTYALIMSLMKDIEDAAAKLDYDLPSFPVIGTLPTGCVNAKALAVPSSKEYLIVFTTGLFRFLNVMSMVIAQAMPPVGGAKQCRRSTSPELVERNLEENPEIVERFRRAIIAFLVLGDIGFTEPWDVDFNTDYFASGIEEGTQLFVMGHEFGHVIHNHFPDSTPLESTIGQEKVEKRILSYKQEYEADWTGAWLTIAAMNAKHYDLAWSCLGFTFFLTCCDFIENGFSILVTGEIGNCRYDCHPSALYRRSTLWNGLFKSGQFPDEQLKAAFRVSKKTHDNMNQLWTRITPALREAHYNGTRPVAGLA